MADTAAPAEQLRSIAVVLALPRPTADLSHPVKSVDVNDVVALHQAIEVDEFAGAASR